jgi:hypothetical protein
VWTYIKSSRICKILEKAHRDKKNIQEENMRPE